MEQEHDEVREARLIAASQRGDIRAFNDLAAIYERSLYTVAYRTVGHADTAADVMQETLLSAFQHIRAYRGGSFRAWLTRIAMNKAYDALRKLQRHREESLDPAPSPDAPSGPDVQLESEDASPEEMVLRHELSLALQDALATLPSDQRTVVVLFDVQGFSYEEIAYVEGVQLGTVKSRLSRGRARLRDYLLTHPEHLPRDVRPTFAPGRSPSH